MDGTSNPATDNPRQGGVKRIRPVALAFALAISISACGKKSEEPAPLDSPAGPESGGAALLPAPPAAAPNTDHLPGSFPDSKTTIENFLAAPNWLERLKYIYASDRLRDRIERYYQNHPDRAVENFHLKYLMMDEHPAGDDYPLYVFFLKIAGEPDEFPVTVRKTEDGMKVDWEIFSEFRDRKFEKFIESGENGPEVFRVILERASYWGEDRDQMKSYLSYQLESSYPSVEAYAFVPKPGPLSETMEEFYSWGAGPIATTVEIERVTFPHGEAHFKIKRLVSHPEAGDGWHIRPGAD